MCADNSPQHKTAEERGVAPMGSSASLCALPEALINLAFRCRPSRNILVVHLNEDETQDVLEYR